MDTARIAAALIHVVNFDSSAPGSLPDGWRMGVTGSGSPRWSVERDATLVSREKTTKKRRQEGKCESVRRRRSPEPRSEAK